MIELKRYCPECSVVIFYSGKGAFYTARKQNKLCFSCAIKARKKRIFSEAEKEQARNQLSKVTNSKEEAEKRLNQAKEKISKQTSGENNPMFGKPAPQGSGNGWSGWYKDWYFRSLRELSFMINVIEKENLNWRTPSKLEGIKYFDYEGQVRTYFPDFIIENIRIIEIKPFRLHNTPKVLSKTKAAQNYCQMNGLNFEIIDPIILTDDEIMKLYNDGEIKFLQKYDDKFQERYKDVK